MKLTEQGTNIYDKAKRVGIPSIAHVRVLRATESKTKEIEPIGELALSYEYLVGDTQEEIVLRSVNVGEELVDVSVKKRADGKTTPRAMIAGITAHDLMQAVGPANFYYANQVDLSRRVDCPHQVAEAIANGTVELGFVSEIPQPLIENVGVLLSQPLDIDGKTVNVIGKISSRINISY